MNNTAMSLVAEELRSTNIDQCKGMVKNLKGSCCALGIACNVYSKTVKPLHDENLFERIMPPREVFRWLGVEEDDDIVADIVEMNDAGDCTFDEIADYIERTLEGVT